MQKAIKDAANEKTRRWSRREVYLASFLALLAVSAVGVSLYGNRGRYEHVDFRLFYGWWTEVQEHIDPYRAFQKGDLVRGSQQLPLVCNNTPALVFIFSPLAQLPQPVAFWIWQLGQLSCLVLAVILLMRALEPRISGATILLAVALVLLFPPLHGSLHYARPTPMLLALVCASWFFDQRSKPAASGLTLAMAALLKLYPAAASGYFLFRRRLSVLMWATFFAALGVLVTGVKYWREFFVYGVPIITNSTYVPSDGRAVSLLLNFNYLFGQLFGVPGEPGRWITASVLTVVVGLMLIALAGTLAANLYPSAEVMGLYFGVWIILSLLLSPISWNNDLVFLMPAYVFSIICFARGLLPSRTHIVWIGLCALLQATDFFFAGLRPLHIFPVSILILFAAMCAAVRSARPDVSSSQRIFRVCEADTQITQRGHPTSSRSTSM